MERQAHAALPVRSLPMSTLTNLFVTPLYRAKLNDLAKKKVNYEDLRDTCIAIAEDDEAGQEWCEREGYPG